MPSFLHMIRLFLPVFFLLAFPAAFLVTGCVPGDAVEVVSETDERNYQRGKQYLREGRPREALSAFLSVIEKRRGDAPDSHLEAGELFRTHIQDPISAIYHYRKYLELSPGTSQADYVRQLIETATKDFTRTLPAHPMGDDPGRPGILEAMEQLKRENVELAQRLTDLRRERDRLAAEVQSSRTAIAAAAREPSPTPTPAPAPVNREPEVSNSRVREYTVESGDTLTRISATVYGTMNRWEDIYEANRDVMRNENSLRPGMVLKIPE